MAGRDARRERGLPGREGVGGRPAGGLPGGWGGAAARAVALVGAVCSEYEGDHEGEGGQRSQKRWERRLAPGKPPPVMQERGGRMWSPRLPCREITSPSLCLSWHCLGSPGALPAFWQCAVIWGSQPGCCESVRKSAVDPWRVMGGGDSGQTLVWLCRLCTGVSSHGDEWGGLCQRSLPTGRGLRLPERRAPSANAHSSSLWSGWEEGRQEAWGTEERPPLWEGKVRTSVAHLMTPGAHACFIGWLPRDARCLEAKGVSPY